MNSAMTNDLLNRILSDTEELDKCLNWLSSQKNEVGDHGYTKIDFVIFFLSYLRLQTAGFFEQKRTKTKSDWKRVTPVTDKPTNTVKPLSTGDTVRRLFSPENEKGVLLSPIKQRLYNADERQQYSSNHQTGRATSQKLFNPQTGMYEQISNLSMNQLHNYPPIHHQSNATANLSMNFAAGNSNYRSASNNTSNVIPSQIQGVHGNVMSPTIQAADPRCIIQGVGQVMSPTIGPWNNVGLVMSPLDPRSSIQGAGPVISLTQQTGPWSGVMTPPNQRSNSTQGVTYHTPRRTNFHRSNNNQLFSNSSSSSGILSPDSPSQKGRGSEGRRGGGGATPKNPCIGDFIVAAGNRKQDRGRKRIKPTRLTMSSGDSQLSDVSNESNVSSNAFTGVPESSAALDKNQSTRASNFDEERKLLKQYNKRQAKSSSKTGKESTSNNQQPTAHNTEAKKKETLKKEEKRKEEGKEKCEENTSEKETVCEVKPKEVGNEDCEKNISEKENVCKSPTKEVKPKIGKEESNENRNKVSVSEKGDTKTKKENNVPNEPKFIRPDPSKVTNPAMLRKLAIIYCVLLDRNLVFNVTSEIHFVVSLLAVKVTAKRSDKSAENDKSDENSPVTEQNLDVVSQEKLSGVDKLVPSASSSPPPPSSSPPSSSSSPPLSSSPTPPPTVSVLNKDEKNANDLLNDVHNSVYFACYVLEKQFKYLQLLDRRTLKLLAENQKIDSFARGLRNKLMKLYSAQNTLAPKPCPQPTVTDPESGICPVQFHAETDNRWTFSSDNSFATYRKQRDELYSILQAWSRMQQCGEGGGNFNKLKLRVEKLLAMSQDPINVRHLAKHFCDLLLRAVATSEENTIEELENLPDVNKSKLSLLTKRLTEPSSEKLASPRPETNFPGFQQFYHDFLVIASQNFLFNVHLINCFVNEITARSSATYDIDESEGEGQVVQEETRQMFVQGLSSLCVLAKFLGLVVFAPYRSSVEISKSVLQEEINIRKQLDPPLKLDVHLNKAARTGSLVYTVPWIVEYLGMMDAVAPHLPCYECVIVTLFNIYLLCSPQRSVQNAGEKAEKVGSQEKDETVETNRIEEKSTTLKDEVQSKLVDTDGNKENSGTKDGILGLNDGIQELKLVDEDGNQKNSGSKDELKDRIEGENTTSEDETDDKSVLEDVILDECLTKDVKPVLLNDPIHDKCVSKDEVSVSKDAESVTKDEIFVSKGGRAVSRDLQSVSKDSSCVSKDAKSLSKDSSCVSKDAKSVSKYAETVSKDAESVSKDAQSVSKDGKSVSTDTMNDESLPEGGTEAESGSKEVTVGNKVMCKADFIKRMLGTVRDTNECGRVIELSPLVSALLRLCLGWLFGSAHLSQELMSRVAMQSDVDRFLVEKFQTTRNKLTMDSCSDLVTQEIIHKFCPYLKSFHALLVKKTTQIAVANIKHVTPISSSSTLMASTTNASLLLMPPEIAIQLQLEDHFFMGQSESVKRTVEFVAERIASACIKEVIGTVVVDLKKKVTDTLERDSGRNKKSAASAAVDIHPLAAEYRRRVTEQLSLVSESRLGVALRALLGPDMCRQSLELCHLIAARKFQERVVNWLQAHINIEEILSKVVTNYEKEHKCNNNNDEDDALEDFFKVEQLEPNKIHEEDSSSKDFSIDEVTVCSKTLIHIQEIASDALETFGKQGIKSASEALELVSAVEKSLKKCPSLPIKKQICIALLDYVILMISFRPDQVTDEMLGRLSRVLGGGGSGGGLQVNHLWSQRNVMLLVQGGGGSGGGGGSDAWRRFAQLTVSLVEAGVVEADSLEQQVVALFRRTWPDNVLQTISEGIRCTVTDLKQKTRCDPGFLDLLSDIAVDISGDIEFDL